LVRIGRRHILRVVVVEPGCDPLALGTLRKRVIIGVCRCTTVLATVATDPWSTVVIR